MVVTAVVGQRQQQRLNTHQTQTVLVVDFHDVNDVFVRRLFKHRDSAMVKKICVVSYLGLPPICVRFHGHV